MKLEGKNAFITGGSRGIGKAICIALAKEGANVAFTYKDDKNSALELVNEIKNLGKLAMCFQSDVRDRKQLRDIFKTIGNSWNNLDILVNNAGINKPTDFNDITDSDWDEIMSVNLKGPFIVTQEAIRLLEKSPSSSIINIGSVSGQYGGPRTAHYAASKAGLISLSQVISRFGASKGIRSNTVAAGIISSSMGSEGLKSSVVAKAAESIVMKRLGTYEEVANAVTFLSSDESSYITSQTINVNGGLYF